MHMRSYEVVNSSEKETREKKSDTEKNLQWTADFRLEISSAATEDEEIDEKASSAFYADWLRFWESIA